MDHEPVSSEAQEAPSGEPSPALIQAAGTWVQQLARTLKTCRLYDGNNPTVVRFREELAVALATLLETHDTLGLSFSSDDVRCGSASLYPARSREDNLALPFHRDGIRGITLHRGIDQREVEALLDSLLAVTGPDAAELDLVGLLWDADLPHVVVDEDALSAGGDLDPTLSDTSALERPPMAWPSNTVLEEDVAQPEAPGQPRTNRSDDWTTPERTEEVEEALGRLMADAPQELQRFADELERESRLPVLASTLYLVRDCLGPGASQDDRKTFERFLPRILREAISLGMWREAQASLALLRQCDAGGWSEEGFVQELLQPLSMTTSRAVRCLDEQETEGIQHFFVFARQFGASAIDWLVMVLAECGQRHTRLQLAKDIALLCESEPERLAPWLSDTRWYLVRNVVHILGWIGGDSVLGLLRAAAQHPEPRVRREVVAALAQVDADHARPLLLELLDQPDGACFRAAVHQLSTHRHPDVARAILRHMQDEGFNDRPFDERRAVYSALASSADDGVLPELEEEIHGGHWLQRIPEEHRRAVARCVARIGTPRAIEILNAGARSRRKPVREACEAALAGTSSREVTHD